MRERNNEASKRCRLKRRIKQVISVNDGHNFNGLIMMMILMVSGQLYEKITKLWTVPDGYPIPDPTR